MLDQIGTRICAHLLDAGGVVGKREGDAKVLEEPRRKSLDGLPQMSSLCLGSYRFIRGSNLPSRLIDLRFRGGESALNRGGDGGCDVKVIPQEGAELLDSDPQVKAAGRVRATNPLRFAPLTGILSTDATGNLLVRRVRVRVTSGQK